MSPFHHWKTPSPSCWECWCPGPALMQRGYMTEYKDGIKITLKGLLSFRTLYSDCIAVQLLPLPNSTFPTGVGPEDIPLNFLFANLHLRVCFLGNPPYDIPCCVHSFFHQCLLNTYHIGVSAMYLEYEDE